MSAVAAGCGSHHSSQNATGEPPAAGGDESLGSVSLQYALPGGEHVSSLTYKLTNGTYAYSGTINVSGSSALSFVVGGVAAVGGYTITLSATSDDGTVSCAGSFGTGLSDAGQNNGAPFAVFPRQSTLVNVQMVCADLPNQNQGGVLVNGQPSCCATWDTIVAYPSALSTTAPNNTTQLTGHASGACSGLSCTWTVISGTGTLTPSATDANGYTYGTFACPTTPEVDTLQLFCSDGPLPDGGFCPKLSTTGTTKVTCGPPPVAYSVVRQGDIGAPEQTDGIATPVYIENHSLDSTTNSDTLVSTVSMPQAASGAQLPFAYQGVNSTTTTSDGALSLSLDGHYLALVGYGATPGTVNIITKMNPMVPRVVGRVDASGNVDTSTYFAVPPADGGAGGAYQNAYIRSAATLDGSAFWVGGSDNRTGGAWYIPFGAAGDGTQLNSTLTRIVNIYQGQLYGDADPITTTPEVFTVGSGVPTAPPAPYTPLPGFPTSQSAGSISGWAFAFADPNTIYIATDVPMSSTSPPIGVQKWTLSGGTWSLQTTFNLATGQSVAPPIGFRGLTLVPSVSGGTTFIASTVEPGVGTTPANHLAVFVDHGGPYAGGASGSTNVGVLFAQAPTNTLYKGIALSPQ